MWLTIIILIIVRQKLDRRINKIVSIMKIIHIPLSIPLESGTIDDEVRILRACQK